IGPVLGAKIEPVTRARVFPGGAIADFDRFVATAKTRWPFLGDARAERMAHAYGCSLADMLRDRTELGEDLGAGLTAT
ncbi:glycerol-3-phosphate dehydrogenase, partial [Escherichia coli]|nr:glycerol-3-phosphate dehydrogenase [Escherichia coli]